MNYRLVNIITEADYICTAVNIDGSTYYLAVAPIIPNVGDLVHFYSNNESYLATVIEMIGNSCRDIVLDRMPIGRENNTLDYREIKKVIATDNPAPIAPTVVDMAKLLADKEEVISYSSADALDPCGYSGIDFNIGFQIGYHTCKKTHGFTDEDMLSFAVFASVHGDDKSLEELFDIWKERQYKVVHYVDNNNMIEVAERLYREANPHTSKDVPSHVYEQVERLSDEWISSGSSLSLYDWIKFMKK